MSKLLSQEEIDALLSQETLDDDSSSVLSPKVTTKELRLYDFRRPERVSKDQIKILRQIHEYFARQLSTYLSNTLRAMVDVKSPVIDQVTYLEYTMSASDYTNMYIFNIDNLDGQAILDIDPDLTFFIIDRLFGGSGAQLVRRTDVQDLSEIERSVLRTIAEKILFHFNEAWRQIDELKCNIVNFETKPGLVTIAPSSETMIVLNFPVAVRSFEFTVLLCFPYFMLEPVLKKLLLQNFTTLSRRETSSEDRNSIQETILLTSLEGCLELGSTDISVADFMELREGNIIVLDKRIDEELVLSVRGKPKYSGIAGVRKHNIALRINHFLNEEGEIINE
ncbi:MAG: flagellar motor switch protein FliM [Candidatus Cloacimonetes bacterium]|nr:flagellar motor switch protein FliM [Candidatus Cloacimonadota bacterium]